MMKKITEILKKFFYYLNRIYRISCGFQKREELVWDDLKAFHLKAEWRSGIYENEKYIETVIPISDEQVGTFYYMIYDGSFHCRVKLLSEFAPDLATDLFILAAHFNNLLNNGKVKINVESRFIEYHHKNDLLVPLLYNGEIYGQIMMHYDTTKDIFRAFQRLVNEQEAPAIIIADLLKEIEVKNNNKE